MPEPILIQLPFPQSELFGSTVEFLIAQSASDAWAGEGIFFTTENTLTIKATAMVGGPQMFGDLTIQVSQRVANLIEKHPDQAKAKWKLYAPWGWPPACPPKLDQ